ncbi:MAG: hypothetical protein PHT84_06665 [Candidatus Pacebacteria bacterium]|nr:hypothetical protein [Candidatus Paceibacterota bacterium]
MRKLIDFSKDFSNPTKRNNLGLWIKITILFYVLFMSGVSFLSFILFNSKIEEIIRELGKGSLKILLINSFFSLIIIIVKSVMDYQEKTYR